MSFKDILVYVDGSSRSYVTLALASRLAQKFQAYLIGLHVVGFRMPSYDPTTYLDGVADWQLIGSSHEAAQRAACESKERFHEQLKRDGIAGEWHVDEGMVADSVAQGARYADLAVVTQVDLAAPPVGTRRHVPQEVLLASGRPVFIVPNIGDFDRLGDNVLVAWNGSREVARAVNDAMPFLERAQKVTVLVVEPQGESEEGVVAIRDIAPHLSRHGVKVVHARCPRLETGTTSTLLGYAADHGVDLLVMGGYGHSRLRALVLGGVSRGILARMTLPVLMSH